jgi:hypothetical protein
MKNIRQSLFYQAAEILKLAETRMKWRARTDSNRRPPGSKPGTLSS